MMNQNGLPNSDTAAPPFTTRDGAPTVKDGAGMGSHVPVSRPQSEARPEVVPSTGEMPAKGGKVLLADPSGPAGQSGGMTGVNGEVPFKNLR